MYDKELRLGAWAWVNIRRFTSAYGCHPEPQGMERTEAWMKAWRGLQPKSALAEPLTQEVDQQTRKYCCCCCCRCCTLETLQDQTWIARLAQLNTITCSRVLVPKHALGGDWRLLNVWGPKLLAGGLTPGPRPVSLAGCSSTRRQMGVELATCACTLIVHCTNCASLGWSRWYVLVGLPLNLALNVAWGLTGMPQEARQYLLLTDIEKWAIRVPDTILKPAHLCLYSSACLYA